jgi:predicted short-subunit dehydrogenase-like oxidoreductase (DUF2520 family)
MKKLKITFIGAGNVATQLAFAFKKKGHQIQQIYSRSVLSAEALANKCNATYTTNIATLQNDADLYIYAVKDSVLQDLILAMPLCNGLHVHTAGSMPMQLFENKQSNYGVFYPFQTFSKNKEIDFEKLPLFIEANTEKNSDYLCEIGKNISEEVIFCSSEQRKALHLSGVFACNFTNHMYAIAEELLTQANIPFRLLYPLIAETCSKINNLQPKEAQTGPAVRNDIETIDKHLKALNNLPLEKEIYRLISKNIQRYGQL